MTDSITSTRRVEQWFANQEFMRTGADDKSTFSFTATFPVARTIHSDGLHHYTLHDKIICTNVRHFDQQLNPLDVSKKTIEELQEFLTEAEWGSPDGLEEIWNWGDDDEDEEDE